MINIDEILHIQDFNEFSRNDLIDIVISMQSELRYYKTNRDSNINYLNTKLNSTIERYNDVKLKLDRTLKTNKIFSDHLFKKLTMKERFTGKINVNTTQ